MENKIKRILFFLLLCVWGISEIEAKKIPPLAIEKEIPSPQEQKIFSGFKDAVDSLLHQMSLEQKVAQMMIIRVGGKYDTESIKSLQKLFKQYSFGGVCFFKTDAWSMYRLAGICQKNSTFPLWITIDGEWGPAMRLTDVTAFPMQQTLGAIGDIRYIQKMGEAVGQQCRRLGISWNYIPTVDVNSNPLNPVINMRSFGESPQEVAARAGAYFQGMRTEGVIASAKHFPGHGDTKSDSHVSLPIIEHDSATLQDVDLYPFRHLIRSGVESVMMGHLKVPSVDSLYPASLSAIWIRDILRKKIGFQGLTITDGLEMDGVMQNVVKGSGETEVRAVEAGEEVLLLPVDPKASVKALVKAVKDGRISEACIDTAVYKILKQKEARGIFPINKSFPVNRYKDSVSLLADLNTLKVEALVKDLYAQAVTLVEDKRNVLPLEMDRYINKACLHIGRVEEKPLSFFSSHALKGDVFGQNLDQYASFDHYYIGKSISEDTACQIMNLLNAYDLVVVSVRGTSVYLRSQYGITSSTVDFLNRLQTLAGEVVLSIFAPPYALACTDSMFFSSLLCGYQDHPASELAMAQVLCGGLSAKGHLPVGVGSRWPVHTGKEIKADALSFVSPEQIGFKTEDMRHIDSMLQTGIDAGAYPGCQVLIAHGGRVFYHRNLGHYTYDRKQMVDNGSIYDLASLTKIFSTSLAYMRMYDQGLYQLDEPVSRVIRRIQRSNKKNIQFRQLLSHESGLVAYMPYVDPEQPYYKGDPVFSTMYSENYPLQVADSLYLMRGFGKVIREAIDKSPLGSSSYKYSDLGFYYLYEAGSLLLGEPLEAYMQKHFYDSLGLEYTGFYPIEKFSLASIVPTEDDRTLRHRQIRGFVHDPLVAFLGGAGGSAGLFSTAEEVAVLAQMLLQKGAYGGRRYIDSNTVKLFTSSSFSSSKNRRGGGFDKPALKAGDPSPCAASASADSYGHSGFTGTFFWVDPEKDLVFVFLSNRVCPLAEPNRLAQLGLRTQIQEYIYQLWEKRGK